MISYCHQLSEVLIQKIDDLPRQAHSNILKNFCLYIFESYLILHLHLAFGFLNKQQRRSVTLYGVLMVTSYSSWSQNPPSL